MKILNDNEIIINNVLYKFVWNENDNPSNDCMKCAIYGNSLDYNYCERTPCSVQLRKDDKNGWFIEFSDIIKSIDNSLPF